MLCWEPCWQCWIWEFMCRVHLNLCTLWHSSCVASESSKLSRPITMKLRSSHPARAHVFASVAELPRLQAKLSLFKVSVISRATRLCVPLKQVCPSDPSCLVAMVWKKERKKKKKRIGETVLSPPPRTWALRQYRLRLSFPSTVWLKWAYSCTTNS